MKQNDGLLFIVKGRLDTQTSPELGDKVLECIAQGNKNITIDMAEVDYVSSAGLRAFLLIAKKLNEMNERPTILSMQPKVQEVFRISGFIDFFNLQ